MLLAQEFLQFSLCNLFARCSLQVFDFLNLCSFDWSDGLFLLPDWMSITLKTMFLECRFIFKNLKSIFHEYSCYTKRFEKIIGIPGNGILALGHKGKNESIFILLHNTKTQGQKEELVKLFISDNGPDNHICVIHR